MKENADIPFFKKLIIQYLFQFKNSLKIKNQMLYLETSVSSNLARLDSVKTIAISGI